MSNYVDVVVMCENMLGLTYAPDVPLWKARAVQASILKKKMAERPNVYTFENLGRVINMLQQRREGVNTAAALCFKVEEMLDGMAVVENKSRLEDAIDWERSHPRESSDFWVQRLMRTKKEAADEVLAEHEESKSG